MSRKDEFIEQVKAQLPPELESCVSTITKLVAMLAEIGFINYNYPNQDVKKVIQFLPRWVAHQKSKDEGGVIEGRLNAHALLTADYLAESLKPTIKAIRKTYFGSEDPPFNSLDEAKAWSDIYDDGPSYLRKEKAEKWLSVFRVERPPTVSPFFTANGEEFWEMTPGKWHWDEAEKEIQELSGKTGISPDSLRFYVLADIKPLTMPYGIYMPGKEYCEGKRKCWYVDIRVNTELSFDDLLELYHTVKEALGVKRGKMLNEKHLELYRLVMSRGGAVKGKGSAAFWELINKDWHNDECATWKGAKLAYQRLEKRLSNQYLTKEVKEYEAD